ncbi:hypothetical protein Barb6_00993 [Bacteroidales bacterium Barb6]|nr:hypothetical protein Barb6_00993 [Bacteroidales bacterium Barb6]
MMDLCMKNKVFFFATSSPKIDLHSTFCGNYFYGYLGASVCKDMRLSIHNGLPHSCCNLSLARRGEIASLILHTLIFCYMPKTTKNASKVNNSTLASTSDYESVNPTRFPSVNLHAVSAQKRDQGVSDVDGSEVVGNNLHGNGNTSIAGSDNLLYPQYNNVDKNEGVTGIQQRNEGGANYSGVGYTITVNQCPQEIIDAVLQLIRKGGCIE